MRVNLGEVTIRKTKDELTDKDWVVLDSLFLQKDIAKMFGCPPATISGKVRRALRRYEELEHPAEQGQQLLKAMDEIVERGKALQKAGVENELPSLGLLAQIAVWTQIDIIKDQRAPRKEKISAAAELRKFLETSLNMRDTFLKTEAMSETIEILKEIIGQLSPPLQEEFAKRVLENEKLRFITKGF